MQIQILLFASIREAVGSDRLSLTLPEGALASAVIDELAEHVPERRLLLDRCALAVNEEYVSPSIGLHEGDIVAVIPPVSGG